MIRWFLFLALITVPAGAAELKVLSAGAIHGVATAVAPQFEAATGNTVFLRNDTVGGLVNRIANGETFDVVLMSPAGLDQLRKSGKIDSSVPVTLAKVGIGVGIRLDAPAPDISTVAAFKASMLAARSVAYIDPASGGSSGIYLARLFQTLGIAEAMAPKSVLVKGGLAAKALLDGQADIALQQISEILAVQGVTLAGPLPADIQNETVYAGAIGAASAVPDVAHAFLDAMAGPEARQVMLTKGMAPP